MISTGCKIIKVADHTALGTTDVTTASVDMGQDGGYEGVIFLTSFGTAAANNTPHAQYSADDATFSDIEGSQLGVGAADEDVYLDIASPRERYVRAVIARGTSTTLESVWAILYGARRRPVTNNVEGTIYGERHVGPAAGTK